MPTFENLLMAIGFHLIGIYGLSSGFCPAGASRRNIGENDAQND